MDSKDGMNLGTTRGDANCEGICGDLPLYWYGELSAEAEAGMERHLTGCVACTEAWEEWKRTFAVLDQDVAEPSPELLAECRDELSASVRFQPSREASSGFMEWWKQVRSGFVLRPLPALAGGLALLAVGFFTARTYFGGLNGNAMVNREQPRSARVRYVSPGVDGSIHLVVEETREREVVGRMEDDSIRGLLVRAAQDSSDPGLRVETIEMLNRGSDTSEVRDALLMVLDRDANAGVRLKAIEGLKAYAQDDGVRRALSGALLRDEDPGVRMQAIDALMRQRRPETVGVLQ